MLKCWCHDMLGMTESAPKFVQNFMDGAPSIQAALKAFVDAVKSGAYPKKNTPTRRLSDDCRTGYYRAPASHWGLKDGSRRIAFVPTMGNLHAGHLALVTQAQACTDAVVCQSLLIRCNSPHMKTSILIRAH